MKFLETEVYLIVKDKLPPTQNSYRL